MAGFSSKSKEFRCTCLHEIVHVKGVHIDVRSVPSLTFLFDLSKSLLILSRSFIASRSAPIDVDVNLTL